MSTIGWSGSGRTAERMSWWLMGFPGNGQTQPPILPDSWLRIPRNRRRSQRFTTKTRRTRREKPPRNPEWHKPERTARNNDQHLRAPSGRDRSPTDWKRRPARHEPLQTSWFFSSCPSCLRGGSLDLDLVSDLPRPPANLLTNGGLCDTLGSSVGRIL